MPYSKKSHHGGCPSDKPIGVVKQTDGKLMGCHATEEHANAQLAALYANEKSIGDRLDAAFSGDGDHASAVVGVLADYTAELKSNTVSVETPNLVDRFFALAKAVVGKAAAGRDDDALIPNSAQSSDWALRLTDAPGTVTLERLDKAAAASAPGGHVDKQRFMLWKQANGQYRWLAVYSNNFRDDDKPSEIISKDSHELFIAMVDAGIVPYPELWHWHVPGTRWGVSDWLGFSDGFALASGTVDPGHEKEIAALAVRDDIGVSHGMPEQWIERDPLDASIITMHVTTEISPLPMWAAANKLTGFNVTKDGDSMALTPQKRDHLLTLGVSPEKVAALETGLKEAADAANLAGIQSKETKVKKETEVLEPTPTPTPEPTPTPQPDPEWSVPTPGVAPTSATPVTPVAPTKAADAEEDTETPVQIPEAASETDQFVTRTEAADAFTDVLDAMAEQQKAMRDQLDALALRVKELEQGDEEKIAKAANETPVLSLKELIAQSVLGQKEARIDGRSVLAKQKPAEAQDKSASFITGTSFLDSIITKSNAANGGNGAQE